MTKHSPPSANRGWGIGHSRPLLLLLLVPAALFGATALTVADTTLANGLRVVVHENHSAPVAAVAVWYKVGAYYERSGSTGLSHLLEHMMFKGTKKFGPGRYDDLIESQGGDNNAFTSDNYTCYWAELASDRYELELELEADRMQNLLLDSGEFDKERNVVMEERRLGENQPTDALYEDFFATAYKTHPYRNPVIGWMDDLGRLTRDDLVRHYRTYYTPSNATLVVAGDVSPGRVFAQAVKHFGKLKSHAVPAWRPVEPPQSGPRTMVVRRDVTTPAIMVGWHVPGVTGAARADSDFYACEVLEGLLLRGRSSRLYSRLLYQQGYVLELWGGNDVEKDPGLFYVFAVPRSVALVDSTEQGIYAQLESLKSVPVQDSELIRVKNQVVADFMFRQDKNRGMVMSLGRSFSMYGSAEYLNQYPERLGAVTKQDIMRVARRYFVEDNRTNGRLLPLPAPKPEEDR